MLARYGVPVVTNAVFNTTSTPRCERKGSCPNGLEVIVIGTCLNEPAIPIAVSKDSVCPGASAKPSWPYLGFTLPIGHVSYAEEMHAQNSQQRRHSHTTSIVILREDFRDIRSLSSAAAAA